MQIGQQGPVGCAKCHAATTLLDAEQVGIRLSDGDKLLSAIWLPITTLVAVKVVIQGAVCTISLLPGCCQFLGSVVLVMCRPGSCSA